MRQDMSYFKDDTSVSSIKPEGDILSIDEGSRGR